MYNGIGLTTARGSGTNGYVQTNKFFIRPKTTINNAASGKAGFEPGQGTAGLARKPNREILEHDRKRQIELKLVVLEDKLVDQGYTDDEIVEKISEARKKLEEEAVAEMTSEESIEGGGFAPLPVANNKVSDTQTHQVAARKEKQMEKLRAALGIVPNAGTQLKKDEDISNLEETNGDHEISDSSDKDLNDDGKFHNKDAKNRNVVATKAVKKHESDRDAIESGSLKKQNKELGELSDSSDTETEEKHLKKYPKHPQWYHQGSASESDSDEKRKKSSKGNRKGRRHDSDYSDDEKYVKGTRKSQDKRTRRHDSDESESDNEKYESERHGKNSRKHGKDVSKSEIKKYDKHVKSDDKKITFLEDDSEDEKYTERHGMKSTRHSVDRWNNKYNTEELWNLTKGKGSTGRNQRNDTDDEDDDHKNIKKNRKSGKHDRYVNDNSESESSDSDGTDGSDSHSKDYKRKRSDKEKGRSDVGVHRSARDRYESSVIEGKGSIRSGTQEGVKEKCVPKKVDNKDESLGKLEELYGSTRDESEYGSREMMKGKRKLEDGFQDEQPETKFRRNEVTDKGFEDKSRSFRNKDADLEREDNSRAKKSGYGHEDKHGGKTYGSEEYQKEISRKDSCDDKKEERDQRGRMRSDLDCREEQEGTRYNRNKDENSGMVRHRKDEDDAVRKTIRDVEGEHRSRRRRGREEEEHTSGRDEKNRLVESSKRAKYDDYRSEEKRKYDGDRRNDRDGVRSRRHS